jgi:BioD-like phosphotransacetylase family protein
MTANKKTSSKEMASKAAHTLNDDKSSKIAKSLAASVLAQSDPNKQTSAEMETVAAKVLQSDKYSDETKSLAGSVISQANKDR